MVFLTLVTKGFEIFTKVIALSWFLWKTRNQDCSENWLNLLKLFSERLGYVLNVMIKSLNFILEIYLGLICMYIWNANFACTFCLVDGSFKNSHGSCESIFFWILLFLFYFYPISHILRISLSIPSNLISMLCSLMTHLIVLTAFH